MGFQVGPVTVSWGTTPSTKTNVSATTATALVATGALLGVAGTYVAPKVVPPVKAALVNGTDRTVAFVKGLWNRKDNKAPVANNQANEVPPTSTRRWYLLYLA